MQKAANYLLFIGFALCLLQVWLPEYFLTGDGPCHVYNAQVLHDLWSGKNVPFYTRFYTAVYKPNPNWLSTVTMALLMFLVNGVIAEKILLTLYVLLFAAGGYLLFKKISNNDRFWPLVIFIFVFTHPLFKGFYNFSFSIAIYFWMVWSWLRFLDKRNIVNGVLFISVVAVVFFTHLLAFVFGSITCASLVISYAIACNEDKRKRMAFLLKHAGFLFLFLLPFLLLMIWFTAKEGGLQIQLAPHLYRMLELIRFRYLVNITRQEEFFATITGVGLLILFSVSLLTFKKHPVINKYDGFLLSLLFVGFVYLFFPEVFLSRLILITLRVQLFVFIIIACCIAYRLPAGKVKNIGAIVLFGCFIGLGMVRIPCQLSASEGVTTYISAVDSIKPFSVVLPLDFSPSGRDGHGKLIADRNWLYCHASQYMGLKKPLIILDNYEAHMSYFPLVWKENVNPYTYLNKYEGFEGQPPFATIEGYKQATGVTIDYILMWCYDAQALQNEHFREFFTEINEKYHIIYMSSTGRTILYAVNKRS